MENGPNTTAPRAVSEPLALAHAAFGVGAERRATAEVLKRRLLPTSVVVLALVAVLGWLGEVRGFYPVGVGILLTVTFGIAGTTALILWFAASLSRSEQSRRTLETRYQRLVEQMPLIVYLDELDDASTNIYTSPQVEALLGYSVDEWTSDPDLFVKLLHPDDRERVLAQVAETNAEAAGRFASEYRLIARDGRVVWVRDESVPVFDEDGRAVHCQGYLLDITARKQVEAELEYLAFHDSLTGLANRPLFVRRIGEAAARDPDALVSVLFLDLDDFKTVNDSLGHGAGDELLQAVAERLAAAVRGDDVVARFGGDEFAILVVDGDGPGPAEVVARRVIATLHAPFVVGGRELFVGASIGVARGRDPVELLRDADIALYTAKGAGKGQHRFFEPSMHASVVDRLELTGELQRPELFDQLVLHYQPAFDLTTGAIESVEALLRWQHPSRGLVAPLEFLPLAEESGVIVAIGRWVLREACMQAVRLTTQFRRERPLTVSVNVSARQLRDPRFPQDVAAVLESTSLPPAALVLEVAEPLLADRDASVLTTLEALRRLGVRIAVDDFGTGHSSLGSLGRLPIDRLKIDRSLARGVDGDRVDAALVEGIVGLANGLGLSVIFEGIERASQLEALRRLRGIGQGFALARPEPAEELELLLAAEASEPGPRLRLVSGG